MNCIIHFEDNGQDFLEWHVERGRVVDSRPFQASIWSGTRILSPAPLVKGQELMIKTPHGDKITLRYRIADVENLPEAFGYEVKIVLAEGPVRTSEITKVWRVKTYRAACRRALLISRAKYVVRATPLSEQQFCAAYGDPRIRTKFN